MNNYPDYDFATNAAYKVLENYTGSYPRIDVFTIVSDLPNVKIHSYSEKAKRFGITFSQFLDIAASEHGYNAYNPILKKGTIFFNDFQEKCAIRFTVAHELGHIILGHVCDNDVSRKEANCFARNLLCPVPLRDILKLNSIKDYSECFDISEYMAEITKIWNANDKYYISKENYDAISWYAFCNFYGYTKNIYMAIQQKS